jgi:cell division protein FtsQ
MTTKPANPRIEFVRQDRSRKNKSSSKNSRGTGATRHTYNARTLYLPTELHSRRDARVERKTKQTRGSSRDHRYDISFNLGHTAVQAPAINLPVIDFSNPRLISGGITIALAIILVLMWTASTFSVSAAEVTGNQRIGADEILSRSGIYGEPIFKAVPEQIEINLRTAFPDIKEVTVKAGFPNRIRVKLIERVPVISWYQDGAVTWIDAEGYAFIPHGEVSGLVPVTSNDSPADVFIDPEVPFYEQRFVNPDVVQAIIDLAPSVPEGMLLIYDPQYGIGWQDPRGWTVQIGQSTKDLQMKLKVYQVLVDQITAQGIQPSLVSLEFLDAPFYK